VIYIKSKIINSVSIYIIIGIFFASQLTKVKNPIYFNNYIIDLAAYFFMAGIFIIIFLKNKADILDPVVFFSAIYITMFSIVPLFDIITENTLWFGVDLFSYGVKGTVISIIGYLAFVFGYIFTNVKKNVIVSNKNNNYNYNKIIFFSLAIWIFGLTMSLLFLFLNKGQSILYIITLGLKGQINSGNLISLPLGFISVISTIMIPAYLIYYHYGKSKFLKFILFYLTSMNLLIRGFRFIIIIFLLAHFYLYYLYFKKRPSIVKIIFLLVLILLLIGLIGFYRNDVRMGSEVKWSAFKLEYIIESFLNNFRIYRNYYSVIKTVPDKIQYGYGQQMFKYTIILFIPRVIWPGKPLPKVNEPIRIGISEYAAKAGQAYPNLGEYYYEFGIFGVVIFMFIFGFLNKKIKVKYKDNFQSDWDLIIYSLFLPAMLQLIIRGYTPSNFYLIISLICPIVFIKKITKMN